MQPPVQSQLPSLEELACGNTAGLRPQTINKTQLDAARPLQQVAAPSEGPQLCLVDLGLAAPCSHACGHVRHQCQPPCISCERMSGVQGCPEVGLMRACCMHADGLDVRWGMQVSRQFVPLVCGRTVAIMDQHAAAERVRLEELQDEVSLSPHAPCYSPICVHLHA